MPSCRYCRSKEETHDISFDPITKVNICKCCKQNCKTCISCLRLIERGEGNLCNRCSAPIMEVDTQPQMLNSVRSGALEFILSIIELPDRVIEKLTDIEVRFLEANKIDNMAHCLDEEKVYGITIFIRDEDQHREYLWDKNPNRLYKISCIYIRAGIPKILATAYLCHEYVHCIFALTDRDLVDFEFRASEEVARKHEEGLCHVVFVQYLLDCKVQLEAEEEKLNTNCGEKPKKLWAIKVIHHVINKLAQDNSEQYGVAYKSILGLMDRGIDQSSINITKTDWEIFFTIVATKLDFNKT